MFRGDTSRASGTTRGPSTRSPRRWSTACPRLFIRASRGPTARSATATRSASRTRCNLCGNQTWPGPCDPLFPQVAIPADLNDPDLKDWVKPDYNPIFLNTQRDPSSAWQTSSGEWRYTYLRRADYFSDESRRRRGRDLGIPRDMDRGGAAAATRLLRGRRVAATRPRRGHLIETGDDSGITTAASLRPRISRPGRCSTTRSSIKQSVPTFIPCRRTARAATQRARHRGRRTCTRPPTGSSGTTPRATQ